MRPTGIQWARDFGPDGILKDAWEAEGRPRPERLDELFADQGVDVAFLFCEYSPEATGIQTFDDLLPIVQRNPRRFRPVANVNPHLHHPIATEVKRQLDHGAAALKLHPVHGGFRCAERSLYPAYKVLQERRVPLVVHCGTSSFPGSFNEKADQQILLPVIRDYDAAFDRGQLARRWIFGTDWPGVPGTARTATAVADLLDHDVAAAVLGGNATRVYAGLRGLSPAVPAEAVTSQREEV